MSDPVDLADRRRRFELEERVADLEHRLAVHVERERTAQAELSHLRTELEVARAKVRNLQSRLAAAEEALAAASTPSARELLKDRLRRYPALVRTVRVARKAVRR